MRSIPAGFLDSVVTDLHICWRVVRRDGEIILGTECDLDVPIDTGPLAGVYLAHAGITGSNIRSTDDLSVDNLEVRGALQEGDVHIFDLSAADIEAGMFDNAECTTFLVNVTDPNLYQHVMRTGWIGSITRTAEGQYRTELRGLTQALSQGILRTYSVGCDAELGDERCKVNLLAFITSGTVTVAISRREFQVGVGEIPFSSNVPGGKITFTSGLNAGYSMEIKGFISLIVTLYLPMAADITVGDTFDFQPGCDKQRSTCIDSYNNIDNFRGHATFVPGQTEILKVGKR
jgi:uncharacterized phage protein (TIGR02218 family)